MINDFEMRLKQIIVDNLIMKVSADEINDESNLVNDFVLDSLQMIRIVMELENEFGVSFQNENNLVELVSNYKSLKNFIIREKNNA